MGIQTNGAPTRSFQEKGKISFLSNEMRGGKAHRGDGCVLLRHQFLSAERGEGETKRSKAQEDAGEGGRVFLFALR